MSGVSITAFPGRFSDWSSWSLSAQTQISVQTCQAYCSQRGLCACCSSLEWAYPALQAAYVHPQVSSSVVPLTVPLPSSYLTLHPSSRILPYAASL